MNEILVEHNPDEERLKALGVRDWPIWSKGVSEFPWRYETPETCYFLAGTAIVTPSGAEPVTLCEGDLVTFPQGMTCIWKITRDVRKHYYLG